MEVINLGFPHNLDQKSVPEAAVALGYFDGVHLGHQRVIADAKEEASKKGIKTAVMTFHPHPKAVLRKLDQDIEHITPLKEKIERIQGEGVDILYIVDFSPEFANLTPQEFVDQYIIGLNIVHVSAGFDYTYGRMGKGTMETLPFHSRGKFTYSTVGKLSEGGEKISSTRIRKLLSEGRTDEIAVLLGRNYTTPGVVIHGDKRGRTIGFPTANVEPENGYLIPPPGVYAVRIKIGGQWHFGVCNIGFKPTFNKDMRGKPSVEVHIFNFSDDVYGENVLVEWHKYLRKEQKFSGIEQLVAQITKDKLDAMVHFGIRPE
ncbi:bifunctional riboflavin kinase/FAD synthetase [Neobacillus piezotolerans]|uniref:Riboflavin biosynthesis protein n=1 Tax=Neobacillus piezotolerans TaxID=2259171 RepID=A0A3D8GX00_9BACI|nr:bifunctional riboflavin kinase/FAD synthetase [Neobacillus piezotolerans]RDU38980.1 bifunctional riboflavin kinase/FAD synthetase [Neobacillus piezotolerans]